MIFSMRVMLCDSFQNVEIEASGMSEAEEKAIEEMRRRLRSGELEPAMIAWSEKETAHAS